jgi:hypothetical protein
VEATVKAAFRLRRRSPVVYGHWNNEELDGDGWPRPRVIGRKIGIDPIGHGVLTAVRIPTET